jgi:hypothetical protein
MRRQQRRHALALIQAEHGQPRHAAQVGRGVQQQHRQQQRQRALAEQAGRGRALRHQPGRQQDRQQAQIDADRAAHCSRWTASWRATILPL